MQHKIYHLTMPIWQCGGGKRVSLRPASCVECDRHCLNVLNQCPITLHLRKYNTRHDAVLEVIESGIKSLLSDSDSLTVDLHSHQPYTFSPHIVYTDLHSDLVFQNASKEMVCLVELTICFKTRYEEAHSLK